MSETLLSASNIILFGRLVEDLSIGSSHDPFIKSRTGFPGQVEGQLTAKDAAFARIYAFSYEGVFYELSRPVLFLVHGTGIDASRVSTAKGYGKADADKARAPETPSLSGVGAADFQISDDMKAWSYDKADYTIRMDVETGMFEDVLLAAMSGGGFESAGMNARGMNARGMNAQGMNARGMNARGMNARGMNARGNSD